ncbi:hypothetical protein DICA0_D08482 [Diutina catenulata]
MASDSANGRKRRRRRCDKRSRNGCLTCKSRRVKCDERHPRCENCQRLSLNCVYGLVLLWEDEALAQGISFGRSKVNKIIRQQSKRKYLLPNEKRQQTLSQMISSDPSITWVNSYAPFPLFVRALPHDFKPLYDDGIGGSRPEQEQRSAIVFAGSETSQVGTSEDQQYLFQHYVQVMGPRMSLSLTDESPANLISPLAYHSALVYTAIAAAAAADIAAMGHNRPRYYRSLARHYHEQTLAVLPGVIKQKRQEMSLDWDEVFATIMLICDSDISTNCDASWLVHLSGARKLWENLSISLTPVGHLFCQYVVNLEVAGDCIWDSNSQPPIIYPMLTDSSAWATSVEWLTLVSETTQLARSYERMSPYKTQHEQYVLAKRNQIETQLLQMAPSPAHLNEIVAKVAEIKRLAALVYLYTRIDMEYFFLRGHGGGRVVVPHRDLENTRSLVLYTDKFRQIHQFIASIIDAINQLPTVHPTLLWPLFVIGVSSATDSDPQRWFILSKIHQIQRQRPLANARMVQYCLERIWNDRDFESVSCRWSDIVRGRGNTLSLA